jgi:predicted ATPase
MRILDIEFESYKSFPDKQLLALRPITIVIGKNSSGKSALSRLPLLLANAFSPDSEEPISINHKGVQFGGSFIDLIYNRLPHGSVKMSINFTEETSISFNVQNVNGRPLQMIKNWSITSPNLNLELTIELTEENIIRSEKIRYTSGEKVFLVTFKGLLPTEIISNEEEIDRRVIDDLIRNLHSFSKNVQYVGPYRQIPERVYFHTGQYPSNVGTRGENAPQILGLSSIRKDELVNSVGNWYQKYLGGWKIDVDQTGDFFQIVLVSPDDPLIKINIVDVGQGMSQVLPLVVQCLLTRNVDGMVFIIEQPELHLHPAAHGDLAELFVDSAKAGRSHYILETHSENIILRIRRLIVQGRLSKDDVIIYWVDDEDRPGSKIKEIMIDDNGDMSDWPKGVFSEDYEEVLAIREAQKQKDAGIN